MNEIVTFVTPYGLCYGRDRSQKMIKYKSCYFEKHLVKGVCATMLSIQQPLLIFTDLDGTLLDSHSYDWQPAAPLAKPFTRSRRSSDSLQQ